MLKRCPGMWVLQDIYACRQPFARPEVVLYGLLLSHVIHGCSEWLWVVALQSALLQTANCRTAVQKRSYDYDACMVQNILQHQDKGHRPLSFPIGDVLEKASSGETSYEEVGPLSCWLGGNSKPWVLLCWVWV
jgi:hypothetical protein